MPAETAKANKVLSLSTSLLFRLITFVFLYKNPDAEVEYLVVRSSQDPLTDELCFTFANADVGRHRDRTPDTTTTVFDLFSQIVLYILALILFSNLGKTGTDHFFIKVVTGQATVFPDCCHDALLEIITLTIRCDGHLK